MGGTNGIPWDPVGSSHPGWPKPGKKMPVFYTGIPSCTPHKHPIIDSVGRLWDVYGISIGCLRDVHGISAAVIPDGPDDVKALRHGW